MEDNLITTKEVGDYRIKVYYCRDSECPITNWGLFGSFFFEYSDTHRLHDECNWKTFFYDNKHDLRDVIDAIVMKHIKQKDIVKYLKKGEANEISFTYNRGNNVWELKHKTSPYIGQEFFPSDLTDFDYRGELIEDLDDEDLLDIISKYGKDVVAIEWSTRGYSQGDYIKGIAYATKEKYDNEVCDKEGDWKEDCAKIIDNEVKSIGMWMWGDVKGYVLEKKVKFVKKYKDESREDEEGEEVLAYHPSWIDEDFNPRGIRIGFWNGGDDFKSAHWWDYQDCYITISHCDCDDNSLFSDRIKNSIEPELWISLDVITNYLPDIKQNHLSQ